MDILILLRSVSSPVNYGLPRADDRLDFIFDGRGHYKIAFPPEDRELRHSRS